MSDYSGQDDIHAFLNSRGISTSAFDEGRDQQIRDNVYWSFDKRHTTTLSRSNSTATTMDDPRFTVDTAALQELTERGLREAFKAWKWPRSRTQAEANAGVDPDDLGVTSTSADGGGQSEQSNQSGEETGLPETGVALGLLAVAAYVYQRNA